jgi:hypothetical protein
MERSATTVPFDAARDEGELTILIDLLALCEKLAKNSRINAALRSRLQEFVKEGNSLRPFTGKPTNAEHFAGENLLIRIARFLPQIVE